MWAHEFGASLVPVDAAELAIRLTDDGWHSDVPRGVASVEESESMALIDGILELAASLIAVELCHGCRWDVTPVR